MWRSGQDQNQLNVGRTGGKPEYGGFLSGGLGQFAEAIANGIGGELSTGKRLPKIIFVLTLPEGF
jgi:hypothetical protein